MAITIDQANAGNDNEKPANPGDTSLDVTVDQTLAAGKIALLLLVFDNVSTSDGPSTDVTAISDSRSNSWSVDAELTHGGGGAAGDGVSVAVCRSKLTTQLEINDTVSVTFGANLRAKGGGLASFSVGAGNDLAVAGIGTEVTSGTNYSASVSGLTNEEHLFIGVNGVELASTGSQPHDTAYTQLCGGQFGTAGGSQVANVNAAAGYLIETSTGNTYDRTTTQNGDRATVLVAYREASSGQNVTAVTLSASPSLPQASTSHTLTAVTLSATPTQPAARVDLNVTAATLTVTPTLPAATVNTIGPAPTFDAATESLRTTTDDPYTFNHTPSGTPTGVLVFASNATGNTDHISGVTYGGQTMSRVASVTEGGISEPGRVYAYFLDTGIPSGTQSVSVDLASATTEDIWFVCVTLVGGDSTELVDFDTVSGTSVTNPSVILNYGGRGSLAFGVIFNGNGDPASVVPLSGMTAVHDIDQGPRSSRVDRQTTGGTSDFTFGYTAAADEVALIALALGTVGGEAAQNVTAVTLTTSPTLPQASLRTDLTAVTLAATPSLPAATLRTDLTAATLTTTPNLPAATLRTDLTAVTLAATPSQPQATLRTDLTAVTLSATPTLPAASITLGGAISTPTVLASGQPALTGGNTILTTSSVSPGANRLLVLFVAARDGVPLVGWPTVSGLGLTWERDTRGREGGDFPRQAWMWHAVTDASPSSGTVTVTFDSTDGSAWYSLVQFEEDEVDLDDPILQPRGWFPDLPPDNGAQVLSATHEMASFADADDGLLHFILIGASITASEVTDAAGFTRLVFTETGSFQSLTEWKASEDLLIDPDWTDSGEVAHYVSIAAEIRAAGATGGRVRDRLLVTGASTTDTDAYTTASLTTYADRDVWLAVTSNRTGATPSEPTITDTESLTWTLVDSQGFKSAASPTQKLWVFRARTPGTDPDPFTITITYPETQTSASWIVLETRYSEATPVQTAKNVVDAGGASGFAATFGSALDAGSGVLAFVAKDDADRSAGADVLTGTVESGYVQHDQSAANETPATSIASFGRHTPEGSPSIALRQNANAAIIALEVGVATGAQSLTAVTLTTAPSLPQASLTTSLTAVTLTTTPTLPQTSLSVTLSAVTLSATPSLPTATLTTANQLAATTLVVTPTQPAATLATTITAVTLTVTPTLPQAATQRNVEAVTIQTTPTLPAASLTRTLAAVTLSVSPTLPAASLDTDVLAQALTASPTLPQAEVVEEVPGQVTPQPLVVTPAFPQATLRTDLTAVTLSTTPTLPQAAVTLPVDAVTLTTTPTFPTASISGQIAAQALTVTPTQPAAVLTSGVAAQTLTTTPVMPAAFLTEPVGAVTLEVAPSIPLAALKTDIFAQPLTVTPTFPKAIATALALGVAVRGPTGVTARSGANGATFRNSPNGTTIHNPRNLAEVT